MKTIYVFTCWLCPYVKLFEDDHWCSNDLYGKSIEEYYTKRTIPDWCPLEAKDGKD